MTPHRRPRIGHPADVPSVNTSNPLRTHAAGPAQSRNLNRGSGGPSARVIWWGVLVVDLLLWAVAALGIWAIGKLIAQAVIGG